MTAIITLVKNVLDSTPVKIIFAVWTGIYLIQLLKQEDGAPSTSELMWIALAMAFGIFLV